MNTLKSIAAVIAGILVNVVLSMVTDFILESSGVFTPPGQGLFTTWMLLAALGYRLLYAILGGYITAALAPGKPMKHVIILGSIGIVLGSVGVIVGWNLSAHWYPLALVVTAFPCTWLGGKLRTKNKLS